MPPFTLVSLDSRISRATRGREVALIRSTDDITVGYIVVVNRMARDYHAIDHARKRTTVPYYAISIVADTREAALDPQPHNFHQLRWCVRVLVSHGVAMRMCYREIGDLQLRTIYSANYVQWSFPRLACNNALCVTIDSDEFLIPHIPHYLFEERLLKLQEMSRVLLEVVDDVDEEVESSESDVLSEESDHDIVKSTTSGEEEEEEEDSSEDEFEDDDDNAGFDDDDDESSDMEALAKRAKIDDDLSVVKQGRQSHYYRQCRLKPPSGVKTAVARTALLNVRDFANGTAPRVVATPIVHEAIEISREREQAEFIERVHANHGATPAFTPGYTSSDEIVAIYATCHLFKTRDAFWHGVATVPFETTTTPDYHLDLYNLLFSYSSNDVDSTTTLNALFTTVLASRETFFATMVRLVKFLVELRDMIDPTAYPMVAKEPAVEFAVKFFATYFANAFAGAV